MRVLIITRATLFTSIGGDTVQVLHTAAQLEKLNVVADVRLANQSINYSAYDLMHFFNLIRPADILPHVRNTRIPYVVTPLMVDYSEFDRQHRKGISGKLFRFFSADQIEYAKTIARWAKGQQDLGGYSYLMQGQRRGVEEILRKAVLLLPNSQSEYDKMVGSYPVVPPCRVIPNGVDPAIFHNSVVPKKDDHMVLCVARLEGLKNQINLIKALNDTAYELYIIGNPATNQQSYYRECRKLASVNIHFVKHLPQCELIPFYTSAKVHVLPSWFETCGLSSLEAAAMGCQVIITDRGYASEYFRDLAYYCEPSSPDSIREMVSRACAAPPPEELRQKVLSDFTWPNAALKTKEAYLKAVRL